MKVLDIVLKIVNETKLGTTQHMAKVDTFCSVYG